jgi:hypothetical protein
VSNARLHTKSGDNNDTGGRIPGREVRSDYASPSIGLRIARCSAERLSTAFIILRAVSFAWPHPLTA